jgi:hypothetical protein
VSETSSHKQNHYNVQGYACSQVWIKRCWPVNLTCKMKRYQQESQQVPENMQPEKSHKPAGITPFRHGYYGNNERYVQTAYQHEPVISTEGTNKKAEMNPLQRIRNHKNHRRNNNRQRSPKLHTPKNLQCFASEKLIQITSIVTSFKLNSLQKHPTPPQHARILVRKSPSIKLHSATQTSRKQEPACNQEGKAIRVNALS